MPSQALVKDPLQPYSEIVPDPVRRVCLEYRAIQENHPLVEVVLE